MPFEEMKETLGGKGKAQAFWGAIRSGIHPLYQPHGEGLSDRARLELLGHLDGEPLIPTDVLTESTSKCGTVKLLVKLSDGQSVESVLIPTSFSNRTTLCVSTQIGEMID
jgi:hypothetical protein